VGIDALVIAALRRRGFRLQAKGLWAQVRSRERWDNRVNHLLRFRKEGRPVRPDGHTLCWALPLPRSHPESLWDATPDPVLRGILDLSARRGAVLDPFAGAGTVGRVAIALGREWIGVERDPHMASLTARRLCLRPVTAARSAARLRQ
jgi:DNA modification methylase